jgi:hypothetical protein
VLAQTFDLLKTPKMVSLTLHQRKWHCDELELRPTISLYKMRRKQVINAYSNDNNEAPIEEKGLSNSPKHRMGVVNSHALIAAACWLVMVVPVAFLFTNVEPYMDEVGLELLIGF